MGEASVLEHETAAAPNDSIVGRVRALLTVHPQGVWIMAFCNLILWTGRGMIIPFTVIFFSQIVGISASIVGTGIAVSGIGGILFVMVIAGQIDRRGGHPVLLACLSTIGIAILLHPLATGVLAFFLVVVLLNFASQLYWPASDATIASISHPDRVPEAMSILRVANAVGIGLGGLTGGILVSGGGMPEYRTLFIVSSALVASATFLVWRAVPSVILPSRSESGEHGTWRNVLPDRTFVYALAVLFLFAFGFTQITMSIPAFLRRDAGISEGAIGLLFTMNTIVIVLTQIPIAGRVNRGDLGRLLPLASLLWSLSFLFMLAAPEYGLPAAVACFLTFTAGELIFMPATTVIPVRLAPLHLRGRYFAATSIVWGGSWAIASFAAGIALDLPQPAILWPIMAALMLLAAIGSLRMHSTPRLQPQPKPTG